MDGSKTLADLLEHAHETIVLRWVELVRPLAPRADLTFEEIRDSLPEFLEDLRRAFALAEPASSRAAPVGSATASVPLGLPTRSVIAEVHGSQRHELGYDVSAVSREYPLLHEVILAVAADDGLALRPWEHALLTRCMGLAAAEAMTVFFQQRDSALLRARDAEAKYRTLFDAIDVGFCIIEVLLDDDDAPFDYRFLEANSAFDRQTGLTNAVGRTMRELVPDHEEHWFEIYGRIARTGVSERFEQSARGLGRDYEVFAFRVGDAAQRRVAVLFNDVTERTLATRTLQERAELEQQLIGIVSHDLKNPLSAILFGAAALLRNEQLDGAATRAVVRIQSSAERAARMVSDLLDFTQARLGGGIPIHAASVNVHELSSSVVEEVQASFPERIIRFHAAGDGAGNWDKGRVAQLLSNLVTNALTYSPSDTPVDVNTFASEADVEIAVHNEGPPIPPDAIERLFQPLQRATTQWSDRGRSVGLGLYIVKQIVSAHGGTISVRSHEGEGTTFRVRLPRHHPTSDVALR